MLRLNCLLAAALSLSCGTAFAQSAPAGDAVRGKDIYVRDGCYACHGYQGQGSNAGSRLAPNPIPFAAFAHQLRNPRARMPAYTASVMSDQALADIYAFLMTLPKARAVAEIPLLDRARPRKP
ncbi:MAG TPA: c-type cytochrome [Steroidobacteraceae bacterium]|jgi:mono/diheme cytochrome c family protein|nr:c-type cytochrome [Steroidobacteraceae bacterium]